MKVLIISDIHDNLVNLEKCLNWAKNQQITQVICCGDITNSETVGFLSDNFLGNIILVKGNMEIYEEDELAQYKNIKYLRRFGVCEIAGQKVGICHEPFFIDDVLAADPSIKIIFYGHTHKPWIETKNNRQLVNPGTLGGVFQKPTFATWETTTNELELKILEDL